MYKVYTSDQIVSSEKLPSLNAVTKWINQFLSVRMDNRTSDLRVKNLSSGKVFKVKPRV